MNLIEDHILLPHRANWASPPETFRRWQTEIADALTEAEARQGMRALPLRSLAFSLLPSSLEERARLDARIDAAKKSGLACAPYFGRGSELAAPADADALTLSASVGWTWQAGDWVILIQNDLRFDVVQVSAVAGNVLTLDTLLEHDWPAGELVWPLFFGKFNADQLTVMSGWHETGRFTLTQTEAERNVSVGSVAAPGDGIGHWKIGSTFIVS